jgi:glycosyltransferase involved in cell wall biosynthesis
VGRSHSSIYLCYAGLDEPLVHTQVIPYLRELGRRGWPTLLVTFERAPLSGADRRVARERLAALGVDWEGATYHTRPYVLGKLLDILNGARLARRLALETGARLFHGRSHAAAAMAFLASRVTGRKMIFDMRGLLADEYADSGHWKRDGWIYRVTKAVERQLLQRSDGIVVLTEEIRGDPATPVYGAAARGRPVAVIPCCVDLDRYSPDATARVEARRRLGWEGRRTLVYAGKLGGDYLHGEMAALFATMLAHVADALFAIFTPSDPALMLRALADAGVPESRFQIGRLPPDEVPGVLAAADAGVALVRPSYSKKAMSPTKLGEYLAAGLPAVINAGIGDTATLLRRHDVGVVLPAFAPQARQLAVEQLVRLLSDPEAKSRCREAARQHFSLAAVGGPRYADLYARVLGEPDHGLRSPDGPRAPERRA